MAAKNVSSLGIEQRKEKFNQAMRLLKEGQDLLKEAGFKLLFDSYNDSGAYAVPTDVDFPDDCAVVTGVCKKSFDELTDAGDFLKGCPEVLEIDGLYNDGTRLVDNVPNWWTVWQACSEK